MSTFMWLSTQDLHKPGPSFHHAVSYYSQLIGDGRRGVVKFTEEKLQVSDHTLTLLLKDGIAAWLAFLYMFEYVILNKVGFWLANQWKLLMPVMSKGTSKSQSNKSSPQIQNWVQPGLVEDICRLYKMPAFPRKLWSCLPLTTRSHFH